MLFVPRRFPRNIRYPSYSHTTKYRPAYGMGKNNRKGPSEDSLILPDHPRHSTASIVDTHTHLVSTFAAYKQKYKDGKYENIYEFVIGLYRGKKVTALVDVWCEAPVRNVWKEIADSAITVEDRRDKWGGLEYWFVMGACQRDDCRRADSYVYYHRCPSVSVLYQPENGPSSDAMSIGMKPSPIPAMSSKTCMHFSPYPLMRASPCVYSCSTHAQRQS
jgi:hypothetical protein